MLYGFLGDRLTMRDGKIGNMEKLTGDRWLSVDEIADYLGIKRDTVYKWIDRKNMPAHKVGSLWKFRKDEIDDWVRSGAASDGGEGRKPR